MHLRRHVILGLALAVGPFMGSARAAGFTYTNTFLLACFRVEGGAADLVVNLGPATAFEALPVGEAVDLPAVDRGQLASAFPILAGVKWSVMGTMRGNTNFPQYPLHTLWISSPSPSANATGAVWTRQGPFTQGTIGSQIEAIGAGAATYGSQQPAGPNNTATGVVIEAADPNAYGVLMTAAGNLAGTFPGDVENETPADFGAGSEPSRSLLYQLVPATGADLRSAGRLLGYFDFCADGTLRFTAGPPPENILSFNGHKPFIGTYSTGTNDFTPVITGQYTCWGFEHIMTRPTAAPHVTTFAAALKTAVETNMVTSPYSIPLSRMLVTRNATGGVVTPQ